MKPTIYSPEARTSVNWASGTSTEIFIYPADGSFATRDFQFRISTATVAADESTFTFFEGITRHLMILKGELELVHEGRYSKHLTPYEQDTFSGEWSTRSKGRVTDFNLMLKGGASGSLMHHRVDAGAAAAFAKQADFHFLYIAEGSFVTSEGAAANAGDLIQLNDEEALCLNGSGSIIEIRVKLA